MNNPEIEELDLVCWGCVGCAACGACLFTIAL